MRVFKKRPRVARPRASGQDDIDSTPKTEPGYWRHRLFKNTFTYKGRRIAVSGWSVKIQIFGKRKTFSLSSGARAKAATEACQIYQTIVAQGWEAVAQRRARVESQPNAVLELTASRALMESDVAYWKQRLIHRKYTEKPDAPADREFSVRIESSGTAHYFPLGTNDEMEAAVLAMRIYQTVVKQGWAKANQTYTRELTLALRWLDDPVAWTYATIHTRKSVTPFRPLNGTASRAEELTVAVIEPDAGIRLALASCANHQNGFRCDATFADAAEALREIPRRRVNFVLANHALADQPGATCVEELRRVLPKLTGLLYSVFEDSDQLFKATPGGAIGYLLKRTAPFRMFEPIAKTSGSLTREQIAARVRDYFHGLFAALPFGPSTLDMAKLTPREHEILALLSKGDLAKEIADSLGISVWTVQGHVKSIFEKLNVHTRTEAVVKFLQK
jgi:DNA-binding NarL/FixJ family response regulator